MCACTCLNMKIETSTEESCVTAMVNMATLLLESLYSGPKKLSVSHFLIDACGACNHLWQALAFVPILTSSPLNKIEITSHVLKFCKRKRSFQWYPDEGDWINWASNVHKNLQSQIFLLHGWEFPVSIILSQEFLNWKKA